MSLATRLKRLTAGALAIVALVAGGLLVAPYFVSDQQARLAALRALRSVTGAEPQIAGTMSFTLLPVPAVHIDDLRLGDGRRSAFHADSLQARMRLLPLLFGRVEIASLTFDRANLTVDFTDGGAIALGLPLRRADAPKEPNLPEVRFTNGTIQFRNGDTQRADPLGDVDAALAWSGSGVTATGSFRWRGQPVTLSLSVADLGVLERGDRSGFRLRLDSEAGKFGFDGGIAYRNGVQADGVVAAETNSLRGVLAHLATAAPITRSGFGPFKFKAQAAAAANSLALSNLTVELDGNRAEGGLTLKQSESGTVVQATLASDSADFTPYSGGFALIGEDGSDWSRELIDLAGIDAFDLDVRFSASRVIVRKTELSRVAATATMRNGALAVSVGEAQFHGGALRGQALLGRNANGDAHVKLEGNVTNFDLGPGISALTGVQRLEGKGNLTLDLESSGPHMHAITHGLTGSLNLTAAGGALTGINVEQTLRRLERNSLSGVPDFSGGRTPFDRLIAKLRVTDGTARVEEAKVESPQVQVKLSGEASVVHRDFQMRGTAMLVRAGTASNSAEPFALPFLLRGPWNQPYLMPDPGALIRRSGAAVPLFARIGEKTAHLETATK